MKIYEVIPEVRGLELSHVVVAKNENDAIEMVAKFLNQVQTHHLYESSDFCVSAIYVDKFSEPTIIC